MTSDSTKGKFSPPPIVYITAALLLIGGVSFCGKIFNSSLSNSIDINSDAVKNSISKGETLFFPKDGTISKLRAAEAFTSGNYATAQALFDRSLQQKPNDPEALIYRNNAQASSRNPLKIAVCVPGNSGCLFQFPK